MTTPQTPQAWDCEAASFDAQPDHGLRDPVVRRAWQQLLLPLVGAPSRSIADLGCGTGTLTLLLARAGHRVVGVDFSPEMLNVARSKCESGRLPVIFVHGDAAEPPLRRASYDVVVARHVLWAMPNPSAAVAAWAQLLTPTGMLLLVEGRWSTGGGLTRRDCTELVLRHRRRAQSIALDSPAFWGAAIEDERYLVMSSS